MEFGEVGFQYRGRVARGVAGYEDGEERGGGGGGGGEGGGGDGVTTCCGDEVDDAGEFVQFVGADVGTVREAEIDLWAQQAVSMLSFSLDAFLSLWWMSSLFLVGVLR